MTQTDQIINTIALAYRKPYADLSISEKEIPHYLKSVHFLEDILRFSRTAFFVVDCKRWDYLYCSANVEEVLGWKVYEFIQGGPVFGLTRLVPEDLEVQAPIHPFMVDYLSKLPESEKSAYKFSFTSRIKHKNGKEGNFLQNNFFLRSDADGQPLLKLITFTDISAYKKNNDVVFYISKMGKTSKNEIVLQKSFSGPSHVSLTTRELVIISASASGLSNSSLANNLKLSINTVKNHKKSILRKLGCSNSCQMIALARIYGLISTQHLASTGEAKPASIFEYSSGDSNGSNDLNPL